VRILRISAAAWRTLLQQQRDSGKSGESTSGHVGQCCVHGAAQNRLPQATRSPGNRKRLVLLSGSGCLGKYLIVNSVEGVEA
jgi:hypothetical protein